MATADSKYEIIIGLEVHAQLNTESKIFCGCSTEYGAPPNSQVCPICLGMPGVLPVLNKRVVDYAMKMAFAVGAEIHRHSIFARKNYFYPDLPKGYQISQYEFPLSEGGSIKIETDGRTKKIGITRIHIEEDAGKSIHPEERDIDYTLVDFNRCGVPLIEIVSKPDMRSPQEAYAYLTKLKQILVYLEICTGDMEKGALRCDANVSVRLRGQKEFGVKTEVKNMNSFKGVEKALSYEIKRQMEIIESGGKVVQQTLLWDEHAGVSHIMRTKEESDDYRYFPEPDLMVLAITDDWKNSIRASLPELPDEKIERFVRQYNIPHYDASVLCNDKYTADYYERLASIYMDYKKASNWVMGEVFRELKEKRLSITDFPITPEMLAELLKMIDNKTISGSIGKEVFAEMVSTGNKASVIIKEKGLEQISDSGLIKKEIEAVIGENPDNLKKYLNGKEKLFGFFVGQVMKRTKGKANPQEVNKILKDKLDALKVSSK